MNLSLLPVRPSETPTSLRQVLEFCACFQSMTVRHDLSFDGVLNWPMVRAVVDLAARSGLVLVAVEFDARRPDGLCLRLEGGTQDDIAFLWHGIAALPGIALAGWRSHANPSRQA
jgi:hypothetical protein